MLAREPHASSFVPSAARMPATLLAAIAIPMPVEHTRMPLARLASEATSFGDCER